MALKNNIKSGLKLATDAAADVTQAIIEKSRLRARAYRLKQIIKNDTETRNQAYIELGKYFYDNYKDSAAIELPSTYEVVEKTTIRINKASKRYFELITESDNIDLKSENTERIKQIMSDKADEIKVSANEKMSEISTKTKEKAVELSDKTKVKATEIKEKTKDKATELSDKTKEKASEISAKTKEKANEISSKTKEKAKEVATDFVDKAKDKFDGLKSFIAINKDLDEIMNDDEESPDEFDF